MKIIYSKEPIEKSTHSIFLAGPITTNNSWKDEACQMLSELNYQGIVYNLEQNKNSTKEEQNFELESLENSNIILFWIPNQSKETDIITTSTNFGYFLKSRKIVYGRENSNNNIDYLDYLYQKEYKKEPLSSLKDTIIEALKLIEKKEREQKQQVLEKRIYRHNNGNLYLIEGFGTNTETLEKEVIYRALYEEGKVWIRPYDMFIEEVENKDQKHRFELQEIPSKRKK